MDTAKDDANQGPSERRSGCWQLGPLQLDLDRHRVSRGGARVELPALSWRLLAELVAVAPETVPTDTLMHRVWGRSVVSDETVKQRVMLLRRALGDDAHDGLIAVDRSRGYRLSELPVPAPEADERAAGPGQNLTMIIAALILTAVAVGSLFYRERGAVPPEEAVITEAIPEITVLLEPVFYVSDPGTGAMFAEGQDEALAAALSDLPGLRLYREADMPAAAATELGFGPRLQLTGTFQRGGTEARIVLRLSDLNDGQLLWSDAYAVAMAPEQRIAEQDRVAAAAAAAIGSRLDSLTRSGLDASGDG